MSLSQLLSLIVFLLLCFDLIQHSARLFFFLSSCFFFSPFFFFFFYVSSALIFFFFTIPCVLHFSTFFFFSSVLTWYRLITRNCSCHVRFLHYRFIEPSPLKKKKGGKQKQINHREKTIGPEATTDVCRFFFPSFFFFWFVLYKSFILLLLLLSLFFFFIYYYCYFEAGISIPRDCRLAQGVRCFFFFLIIVFQIIDVKRGIRCIAFRPLLTRLQTF